MSATEHPGTGRLVAGRYRLESRLGSGAMGTVWLGTDELLARRVAVKEILSPPGASGAAVVDQRARALREGRIAARLDTPHAISLYDVALDGDEPWLVMEYLPSRNLAELLRDRHVLPVEQVAQVGAQVADAMAAAHAAGIVHRDIKPGNILVGDGADVDGLVKITDFGISHADGDVEITQVGTISGTPAYFAPDVARGAQPSPASDVFSLGATLYTCLEGAPPFGLDDNTLALMVRVADGVIAPPVRAGALEPVLRWMLRTDPATRPTMVQVRGALAEVAAGRPGAVTEVLAARTRLSPVPLAAAVLAVGAAGVAGVAALAGAGDAAGAGGAAGAGAVAAPGAEGAVPAVGGAVGGAVPAAGAAVAPAAAGVAQAGWLAALVAKPALTAAGIGAALLAAGGVYLVTTPLAASAPGAAPSTSQPATPAVDAPTPTPPITTTTAPTISIAPIAAGPSAADADRAVRALLGRLFADPAATLATAGPALQGVGPDAVSAYANGVRALEATAVRAQDGGTVVVDLLITRIDGSTRTEQVAFTVTDTLLVDSEDLAALLAAGPPLPVTGIPAADPTPTPTATPPAATPPPATPAPTPTAPPATTEPAAAPTTTTAPA